MRSDSSQWLKKKKKKKWKLNVSTCTIHIFSAVKIGEHCGAKVSSLKGK